MTEKKYNSPKTVFWAGMFYMFLLSTLTAFIFHFVGLKWFECTVKIKEPSIVLQKLIKAALKIFELGFVFKILIRKSFLRCIILATIQVVTIGFIPIHYQAYADIGYTVLCILLFRKHRFDGLIDYIVLFILMNLYSLVFVVARFGGIVPDVAESFYTGIASVIDYKLFIVTLYMYIKYKGGIKLWKMKRRIFQINRDPEM